MKMGWPLVWDATCVDTLAPSHLPGTQNKTGAAADSTLDSGYIFEPFGVETIGPWEPGAHRIFKDLSARLVEATRDQIAYYIVFDAGLYLAQRLSIAIQRGNAASILGTLPTGRAVLSQFDFPEVAPVKPKEKKNINTSETLNNFCKPKQEETQKNIFYRNKGIPVISCNKTSFTNKIEAEKSSVEVSDKYCLKVAENSNEQNEKEKGSKLETFISLKHAKRKIINSYFDHQTKRKFPGPAGLLTGSLEEPKDESICQIELLSQDIDCTQQYLQKDLFESPIWNRLLSDTRSWKVHDNIDGIKAIKQQALSGNLRRRKAKTVAAFVEAVDRSAIDPLIILRDATGTIKCTLHRDAWSMFSPYIVSEYCALVLQKPTVLTTGSAFKKHYLNITLSNILAIYSSTIIDEDGSKSLPDGYRVMYQEEFTVIKTEKCSDSLGTSLEQSNGAEDLFDGLDSFFSDDTF